jgi:uncharacterized protein (TIGR02145 family)
MRISPIYTFCLFLIISLICSSCKKSNEIPSDKIPIVETGGIVNITNTTALCGGGIITDNDYTVTDRGVCWSTGSSPTINDSRTHDGAGAGGFTSFMTGLMGDTRYYVRAYASNAAGTGYGSTMSFVTGPAELPAVLTDSIFNITTITASCHGNTVSSGGAEIIEKGICWSTVSMPTINEHKISAGSGSGAFSVNISGLTDNTLYHVRAFATNSKGIVYGEQVNFRTKHVYSGTVTDFDGNIYNTIVIGQQTWMADNLKTTHYNDGSDIFLLSDPTSWMDIRDQAFCWYNNDPAFKNSCGALYNWFAIETGKLCPPGWHVPSYAEWNQLLNTLGGINNAGGRMMDGEFNASGFTAKYCGNRSWDGSFSGLGTSAGFWSTTIANPNFLSYWFLKLDKSYYDESAYAVFGSEFRTAGLSVRCVKD